MSKYTSYFVELFSLPKNEKIKYSEAELTAIYKVFWKPFDGCAYHCLSLILSSSLLLKLIVFYIIAYKYIVHQNFQHCHLISLHCHCRFGFCILCLCVCVYSCSETSLHERYYSSFILYLDICDEEGQLRAWWKFK